MFTIFKKKPKSRDTEHNILLQFAFPPLIVGLIATVLGVYLVKTQHSVDFHPFSNDSFLLAFAASVSIFIVGIGILTYSLIRGSEIIGSGDLDSVE
jgi:hypothetical protein